MRRKEEEGKMEKLNEQENKDMIYKNAREKQPKRKRKQ